MKRLILTAFICIFSFFSFAEAEKQDAFKLRVVPLSHILWQSIQDLVNTNGYCHIKEQNVVLVITNGCPNAEYLIPIQQNVDIDLDRNKLRMKGKRGDKVNYIEPVPYVGQGGW